MRILFFPMHGSYADAFVRGPHEYLLPWRPGGGAYTPGRGAYASRWGANVRDVAPEELGHAGVDLVVLQRLEELELVEEWLGARPGRDVPAVFLEHNTPKQNAFGEVHALADGDLPIVHVTHFNALAWDTGSAPTLVIEHGVVDPGPLYRGDLDAIGVVINEPVRRMRVVGTDLLPRFSQVARVDHFGIDGQLLPGALGLGDDRVRFVGDVPMDRLHAELARRRLYLHPNRWTSLGLSLLEAMHLGMPVLALAMTEAPRAVPSEAGAVSNDVDELLRVAQRLLDDPDEARRRGIIAREAALERYALQRFLDDWSTLFADAAPRLAA